MIAEETRVQTWVDLLSHEAGAAAMNGEMSGGSSQGLKVTMDTPVRTRSASKVDRNREEGRTDIMRSQIVSLLKQKQELVKQVMGCSPPYAMSNCIIR